MYLGKAKLVLWCDEVRILIFDDPTELEMQKRTKFRFTQLDSIQGYCWQSTRYHQNYIMNLEDFFINPAVKNAITLLLSRDHIKVLKDTLAR